MRNQLGFGLPECLLALVLMSSFLGGIVMLIGGVQKENRLAEQMEKATAIANDQLEQNRISPVPAQVITVNEEGIAFRSTVERKQHGEGETQVEVYVSWTERGISHEIRLSTLDPR